MYSFFLAGSFQFSFRNTLPSAHFVYRLFSKGDKMMKEVIFQSSIKGKKIKKNFQFLLSLSRCLEMT